MNKLLQQSVIEFGVALAIQVAQCCVCRDGRCLASFLRYCIVGIDDASYAGEQRYFGADLLIWVAAAIEPFVMIAYHFDNSFRNIIDTTDDLESVADMFPHEIVFSGR
jgi:hypothetical protein